MHCPLGAGQKACLEAIGDGTEPQIEAGRLHLLGGDRLIGGNLTAPD